MGVGRWVRAGSPPGRWVGDHLFSGSSIHRSKAPVERRRSCTRQRGRRTVGVATRAFAVGVGWTAGSPPGRAFKKGVGSLSRRRFRAALAGTPLLDLAAAPHLAADPDLAAAAPNREGTRAPSPRPPPKNPPGSQRSPSTAYMRRYREAEENFLGVGWSILGVGWHTPSAGRWMRWMPLAKALGGVRARREATARSALMRAPAGSSRPRKVDGGGIGHPGSGGV